MSSAALSDFLIWGTISQIAPWQFVITVSAVPEDPASLPDGVQVVMRDAPSRERAVEACAGMVREMGHCLRARGNRVIDVEEG